MVTEAILGNILVSGLASRMPSFAAEHSALTYPEADIGKAEVAAKSIAKQLNPLSERNMTNETDDGGKPFPPISATAEID